MGLPKDNLTSQLILVVEDNEPIRNLIITALSEKGYSVLDADNPISAVQKLKDSNTPPALLITDIIMPGMNGAEFYQKLIKKIPTLKVLFISGYSDDLVRLSITDTSQMNFLQKPFTLPVFLSRVQELLKKV